MRIVNPSFGTQPVSSERIAVGAVDWRKDPIILFSNSKPNARELLHGLRDKLGAVRALDGIDFVFKESASQPAAPAILDQLVAKKYRAAILALGD